MSSWWTLGDGYGIQGNKLELFRITCPFCEEKGNVKIVYHAEKNKPNSSKKLNFDTLECGNCKGYIMVMWSASEYGGLYDYKVLPWPLKYSSHPEHWPDSIGRYWLQAKKNIKEENWDAATVMARSALQLAIRDHKGTGANLKQEIQSLASKGVLPPLMKDWAEHVRELGNDSAHPKPLQDQTDPNDAKDIVHFLEFLLEYLYDLPHKIKKYRDRREKKEPN